MSIKAGESPMHASLHSVHEAYRHASELIPAPERPREPKPEPVDAFWTFVDEPNAVFHTRGEQLIAVVGGVLAMGAGALCGALLL